MKRIARITSICLVIVTSACSTIAQPSKVALTEAPQKHGLPYGCLEALRSSDPDIVNPCIEILVRIGDLEALSLLHYKWIAEPDPDIRRHILAGFKNIGDHRFLVDPAFPRMWHDAAMRFCSPEKEQRQQELEEYYPSEDIKIR